MNTIIYYSKSQLEATVNYIAKNNKFHRNNHSDIRTHILSNIDYLAMHPEITKISTMGFLLTCDFDQESVDFDYNVCRVDIYVNPTLGIDVFSLDETDVVEKIIEV